MTAPTRLGARAEAKAWNRLDVRRWPALARTRITVTGVLDCATVEAVDAATQAAEAREHAVSVDLTHVSRVTPSARVELLARDDRGA